VQHTKIIEFWAQVEKTETCWVWKGFIRPAGAYMAGYGFFGKSPAHRLSYELANGPMERGLVTMHLCNNKLCVNPLHLRAGTNQENLAQAKKDGRFKRGDPSVPTQAEVALEIYKYKIAQYNPKDLCKYGHEFSGENVRYDEKGCRICMICHRRRCAERNKRKQVRMNSG
jgi:hypothetical protein